MLSSFLDKIVMLVSRSLVHLVFDQVELHFSVLLLNLRLELLTSQVLQSVHLHGLNSFSLGHTLHNFLLLLGVIGS